MLEILGKYSDKTAGVAHTTSSDPSAHTDNPENRKKQMVSIKVLDKMSLGGSRSIYLGLESVSLYLSRRFCLVSMGHWDTGIGGWHSNYSDVRIWLDITCKSRSLALLSKHGERERREREREEQRKYLYLTRELGNIFNLKINFISINSLKYTLTFYKIQVI